MNVYDLSLKGKRWWKRKELDEPGVFPFFVVIREENGMNMGIPVYDTGKYYEISAGGALYGGTYADFKKTDSFYVEVMTPLLDDKPAVLDELAADYFVNNFCDTETENYIKDVKTIFPKVITDLRQLLELL